MVEQQKTRLLRGGLSASKMRGAGVPPTILRFLRSRPSLSVEALVDDLVIGTNLNQNDAHQLAD